MNPSAVRSAVFSLLVGTASACAQNAPVPAANEPFAPSWPSLESRYAVPEWFRDAKFGIWAHWGPQCEEEAGDWYARFMYDETSRQGRIHRDRYGSASQFGFKDVIHKWTAAHWDPDALVRLYREAGAKYFVALACHHDNFDLWNSTY